MENVLRMEGNFGFSDKAFSISTKVIIGVMIALLFGVTLMVSIPYWLNKKSSLEKECKNLLENLQNNIQEKDERVVRDIVTQMNALSKDISILDGREKDNRLNSFLNQNPFFLRVLLVRDNNVQEAFPLENGKVRYKKLYPIEGLKAGVSELSREEGKSRTLSVSIRHDDSTELVVELDRDKMSKEFFSRKVGIAGYYYVTEREFVVNEDGKVARTTAHPKAEKIDAMAFSMFPFGKDVLGKSANVIHYVFNGQNKYCAFSPGLFAIYAVSIDEDEFLAPIIKIRRQTMIMGVLIYFIVLFILYFTIKIIVINRINRFKDNIKSVAEGGGDLTHRVMITSQDELGDAAKYFNMFLDFVESLVRDLKGQVEELTELKNNSETSSVALATTSTELDKITESFFENMKTIGLSVAQVKDKTTELTMGTNGVSSAAEEMASAIQEIAFNTEKGRQITEEANKKTQEINSAQRLLEEEISRIDEVTDLITEISDQTNLLALNATIEAARAGEAGKGFAVVASEIKELSKRTAEATLEIKKKIEAIQDSSSQAISKTDEISGIISNLNDIVGIIATAVEEQSVTTNEIAKLIARANCDTNEIDDLFKGLVAHATDFSSNAKKIGESSCHVKEIAESISVGTGNLVVLSGRIGAKIGGFKTSDSTTGRAA